MKTEIKSINNENLLQAADFLKKGELVGMPTETVYGLAANAFDETAIAKIFKAKGRPQDNPLIVHISKLETLYKLAETVPPLAIRLAEEFCPGSLTMIFKKKEIVPFATSGGLDTVAIRMPDNEGTLNLIEMCGFPLAAPSANISGSPSPTTAQHVFNDMNGKIPLILDGGECRCGVESTVITFTENGVKILRPGAVTAEMLSAFTNVETDKTVFEKVENGTKVISPGVKYKHYSPKADVIIIDTESDKLFSDYVTENSDNNTYALIKGSEKPLNVHTLVFGETAELQAQNLFAQLREIDELGAKKAFVRCPEKKGVGVAVYNRLLRAAAFKIVKL